MGGKEIVRSSMNEEPAGLQLNKSCYYINCIRNRTRNGLYLTAVPLEKPNPNCFVCKNAVIPLTLNVNEWTLQELLQRVIKGRLGFEEPTLMLQGDFIWEEGDGADEVEFKGNLSKKLSELPCGGIQHGTVLEIDDNSQSLKVCITITHQDEWEGKTPEDFPFVTGGLPPKKKNEEEKKPAAAIAVTSASTSVNEGDDNDDDDDVILIIDEGEANNDENREKKVAAKRSIEETADGEKHAKRRKTEPSKVEVIEIGD